MVNEDRVQCPTCDRFYSKRALWYRTGERSCYICQGRGSRSDGTIRGCVFGAHRLLIDLGELPADTLLTPELEVQLESLYRGLADKRATYESPTLPERIVAAWRAGGVQQVLL